MKRLKCKGNAPARTRLATALMLAIGCAGAGFAADASQETLPVGAIANARVVAGHSTSPATSAVTYEVTSCADDGSPGTLRYVIAHAATGDTADLSNLACSTITLASGEILIPQHDLTISGSHPITIDAGQLSRVIEHNGTGTLALDHIDAVNGLFKYNSSSSFSRGGCILSEGYLRLSSSSVSGCSVAGGQGWAIGGGVAARTGLDVEYSSITSSGAGGIAVLGGGAYSAGPVRLFRSTISGNNAGQVSGTTGGSVHQGGGLWAGGYAKLYMSSISGNRASTIDGTATGGGIEAAAGVYLAFTAISGNAAAAPASSGGGVTALANSAVFSSTIDHNQAVNNAGAEFRSAGTLHMGNSTISSNTATTGSSALFSSIPTFINNTTIAFNTAHGHDAGIYFNGGTLDIESTIVSNNTSSSGSSDDIVSLGSITGAHNLIMNPHGTVPGDTLIGIDPLLEPLANNYSPFPPLTHALAPTSPAIDHGSNPRVFPYDERFALRVIGIAADIGAYEYTGDDTDTIFKNGFEPPRG